MFSLKKHLFEPEIITGEAQNAYEQRERPKAPSGSVLPGLWGELVEECSRDPSAVLTYKRRYFFIKWFIQPGCAALC